MRLIGALLLVLGTSAFGQVIIYDDPTNFHTGNGVNGTCPTGAGGAGCPFFYQNSELQPVGSEFDLYFNTNGKEKLVGDEVVLIIGVPNDSATTNKLSASAITSVTEYDPLGGAGASKLFEFGLFPQVYGGGHGGSSSGFQGLMSDSDVYSFLSGDFAQINNSNNFVNWSGADATLNPTVNAANFGIYVWSIHTTTFQGTSALDIISDGSIPVGSFIVGFGENRSDPYSCKVKGKLTTCVDVTPFGNPFTQAGIVTSSNTTGGTSTGGTTTGGTTTGGTTTGGTTTGGTTTGGTTTGGTTTGGTTTGGTTTGGGSASGGQVPEPSTMLLLGSGLLFTCVKLRKKFARS